MSVRRIYVEKMEGLDVAASGLLADIKENLGIKGLEKLRILIRYDVENISDDILTKRRLLSSRNQTLTIRMKILLTYRQRHAFLR